MPAPLPIKVRESIVHAHTVLGLTYVEIVAKLRVCESTVVRVLRRHRTQGSVAPLPRGGGNFSPIQGPFEDALRAMVAEMPDATLAELTDALRRAHALETSISSVKRALERFDFTRKKRPSPRPNATRRRMPVAAASLPKFSR